MFFITEKKDNKENHVEIISTDGRLREISFNFVMTTDTHPKIVKSFLEVSSICPPRTNLFNILLQSINDTNFEISVFPSHIKFTNSS